MIWRKILDSSVNYFNKITIPETPGFDKNPFYEFINFTDSTIENLKYDILRVKKQLAQYFNRNIYPDFKRIFYTFKNSGKYELDSLKYLTNLFNIDFDFSMIKPRKQVLLQDKLINTKYRLADALDLISRYLQLNYIADNVRTPDTAALYKSYNAFFAKLNIQDPNSFKDADDFIMKDDFFRSELNANTIRALINKIRQKFPYRETMTDTDGDGISDHADQEKPQKYYFPKNPPFPSCIASVPHFRPGMTVIKDINTYLRNLLISSGYQDRFQYYYYASNGFAITTKLERIKKNGSIDTENRWENIEIDNQKFSLFNIFRTIFFANDGNFRIIALVISSDQVVPDRTVGTFAGLTELLKNSYSSLPKDLEDISIPDKTISILVYHFYQSDIGNLPQLDITQKLTISDHLKGTPLANILN